MSQPLRAETYSFQRRNLRLSLSDMTNANSSCARDALPSDCRATTHENLTSRSKSVIVEVRKEPRLTRENARVVTSDYFSQSCDALSPRDECGKSRFSRLAWKKVRERNWTIFCARTFRVGLTFSLMQSYDAFYVVSARFVHAGGTWEWSRK